MVSRGDRKQFDGVSGKIGILGSPGVQEPGDIYRPWRTA